MPEELADLTPEMRAAINREGPPTTCEVTALGIRTFARAIGYTNPIYYDAETAQAQGHRDVVAPPGYYGMPVFIPSRPAAEAPAFASPFTRNLNGGTEVEPLAEVCAGDVLEARSRITKLELAKGRLGQMLVRSTETVYTRRTDGTVVGRTRGTGLSY